MAGITLAQAEAQLASYLAAETKILSSQEYQVAGRNQRRAMLSQVQDGISIWNERVQALSRSASGRGRAITVSPR
jgi:hypothetical protein